MSLQTTKKISIVLILLIAGFLSASFIAQKAAAPNSYQKTIESIDEKVNEVLKLAAASALTSAGVSMIPGDTATPIAEKLADFSQYFLLVLCVLYTEKYILTLVGTVTFRILIPLACLFLIIGQFRNPDNCKRLAKKMIIVGIIVFLAIPACMHVSDLINNTYQSSLDETLSSAQNLNNKTNKLANAGEDKNALEKIWDNISESAVSLADKAADTLNHFTETLAVLIVTTCILPLLTLLLFVWLIKTITGIDINESLRARFRHEHRIDGKDNGKE